MTNGMFIDLKSDMDKAKKIAVNTLIKKYMDKLEIICISKNFGNKILSINDYFIKNPINDVEDLNGAIFVILTSDGDLMKVKFIVKREDRKSADTYLFGYDVLQK